MGISQYGLLQNKGAYDKSTYDWWKSFTNNGNREYYEWAFRNTDFTGKIIPPNLCKPKYSYGLFFGYVGTALPSGIDFSRLPLGSVDCGNQTFAGAANLTIIPDLGIPVLPRYSGTYGYSPNLETIEKIRVNESTTFAVVFTSSPKLKNITIEGTIGQSGLSFADNPLLTAQSLSSILNALSATSTGKSITFKTVHKDTYNAANPVYTWDWFFASRTNWTVVYA